VIRPASVEVLMSHRSRAVASAAIVPLLSLTGCSLTSDSASAESSPPPLDAAWQCEDVPESPDGTYDVDGAGQVTIAPDGERLSPVGAAASPDYGDAETRLYDTAAEVEFRHRTDGSRVMLRVEIHGEGREVQLCRAQQ
jgi:hypothetical protein